MSISYQLALRTPGIRPLWAISLKQTRQIPKRRIKPRGRPQMLQRWYARTLNLGFLAAFSIKDCFAKSYCSCCRVSSRLLQRPPLSPGNASRAAAAFN